MYLASNPETACMEVKSQFGDLISLATFELIEPLHVIDFASDKQFTRSETGWIGCFLFAAHAAIYRTGKGREGI